MYKLTISLAVIACAATFTVSAADDNKMKPSGTRCAGLGEYCKVPHRADVRMGGCKSTDMLNGTCSTSKAVEVSGGIDCRPENFGLKAPLPNVGPNSCWWEPVAARDYSTSSSSSSSSSSSGGPITGATCQSTGTVTVEATILVAGSSYDGKCKTFLAGPGLKAAGADRSLDKPIFRVTNGATLKDVIIGDKDPASGGGGVHVSNGGKLDNVRWINAPVSAVTVQSKGKVEIQNVSADAGAEQLVLVNSEAEIKISNCVVGKMKKFISQKPGSTAKVLATVDRCRLSELKDGVFRSDSSASEAAISGSKLDKTGTLCLGKWGSCAETTAATR